MYVYIYIYMYIYIYIILPVIRKTTSKKTPALDKWC